MDDQINPSVEAISNPVIAAGVYGAMGLFVIFVAIVFVSLGGILWKSGYFSNSFWRLSFQEKIDFGKKNIAEYWTNDALDFERRLLGKGLAYGFLCLLVFGTLIYLYGQPPA